MLNRYDTELWSNQREDYLPYQIGTLSEAIKAIAEKELSETEETKQLGLQQLRKKIAEEKNFFPRPDEHFLLQFLRSRKYDINRAFRNLQTYYKFRKKYAYIYDSGENAVVHDVFRMNYIGFLPHRNKDGSVIVIVKLGMWDPTKVSRDLLLWTATHCAVYALEDEATQVLGITMILDLRGIGRVKGVHVIGLPPFFSTMWDIVYPFLLSSKLKRRVIKHGDNLKSLHSFIPPCILPSEYGGETGPFDNSEWHAGMLALNEKGLNLRQYGYRE